MKPAHTGRLLLASCGVVFAVCSCTAQAATLNGPAPGAPAPGHQVHSIPSSQQQHFAPGPYIAAAKAEQRALAAAAPMGRGARVVRAQLMSVTAASKATGQRVASYFVGPDRMIWLVWMKGPWKILNCITASGCAAKPDQLYYVTIDAKTGTSDGLAWRKSYPKAPAGH